MKKTFLKKLKHTNTWTLKWAPIMGFVDVHKVNCPIWGWNYSRGGSDMRMYSTSSPSISMRRSWSSFRITRTIWPSTQRRCWYLSVHRRTGAVLRGVVHCCLPPASTSFWVCQFTTSDLATMSSSQSRNCTKLEMKNHFLYFVQYSVDVFEVKGECCLPYK